MTLWIGITPTITDHDYYEVNNLHAQIIEGLGAIPLVLPYIKNEGMINDIVDQIDGLYITGGDDIDPTLFGEEPIQQLRKVDRNRDLFEKKMIQKILRKNKPIFAVCRGVQILNIAIGGTMYQHIYTQMAPPILQHEQGAKKDATTHFIDVLENTLLFQMVDKRRMKVNSFHHQAIRTVPAPFTISATSSDNVIEAIESSNHLFAVGVQWHPEFLFAHDQATKSIYKTFLNKCIERKQYDANY